MTAGGRDSDTGIGAPAHDRRIADVPQPDEHVGADTTAPRTPVPPEPPADGERRDLPAEPSAREIAEGLRYQLGVHLRDRQRALADGTAGTPHTPRSYPDRAVRRPVAVTIFVADDDRHQAVQQAVGELLGAFDLEVVDSLPPVWGSWYRALVAQTRQALTSRELRDRLRKVERGAELHLLHRQQAEIDSLQGGTVANLLTALAGTENAIVQIGSILIVKADGVPAVRNLTQEELIHLERNPRLLKSPRTVLEELQAAGVPRATAPALVDQES